MYVYLKILNSTKLLQPCKNIVFCVVVDTIPQWTNFTINITSSYVIYVLILFWYSGSSVGIYYSVSIMATEGARVTIDAAASATFNVSTEILTENLMEVEADFSLVAVEEETVVRRSELVTIAVKSSVLTESFESFETAMTEMVSSKVSVEGESVVIKSR